MILFLVVGLVVLVGLAVAVGVSARRRDRELPIEEQCEVCGAWLTTKTAVVLAVGFDDGLDEAWGFGGTGMTAYYCHRHAP